MPDDTAVEDDWTTWSDAEVLGRLMRRGIEGVYAKGLVRDRVMPESADEIFTILSREYKDDEGKVQRFETPLDRRPLR
jgi:predicted transcriptional regulator